MKKCFLVLAVVLISLSAQAQKVVDPYSSIVYVYSEEDKPNDKRGSYATPHVLGEEVLAIANKIERSYVYYNNTGGAYAVEEKKVVKPRIYKAYKRLDKYYSKGVASGKLDVMNAKEEVLEAYGVILKLLNYETEKVEADLKKIKDPEQIISYLKQIKFR